MQGILRYLGIGSDKARTRDQPCRLSGMSDRAVRKEIETLRNEGVIIINRQDGKGYYISEDPAEMEKQYKQNHARAMAILRQQRHLRRKIKEVQNETLF